MKKKYQTIKISSVRSDTWSKKKTLVSYNQLDDLVVEWWNSEHYRVDYFL